MEAIAAEARKDLPDPGHWKALVDAEEAALSVAYGSPKKAGGVVLGIVLNEGDFVDGALAGLVL